MRRTTWIAAALCLLAPSRAPAQPSAGEGGAGGKGPTAGEARAGRAMAEEIEIMRRLLNRELLERPVFICASCHDSNSASVRYYAGGNRCLRGFAFSPDGRRLATGTSALNPDGRTVATGQGNTVQVWDPTTGKLLGTHPGPAHGATLAEGFYLKDHGVIYTLTAPPPRGDPR